MWKLVTGIASSEMSANCSVTLATLLLKVTEDIRSFNPAKPVVRNYSVGTPIFLSHWIDHISGH